METVELAQTYIHIRPLEIHLIELDDLGSKITDIARRSAKQIYHHEIELEVRIEEGSIKVWATVLAILASTYSGIANYKGFKESVVELCSDARQFGGDVCGAVTNIARSNKADVFRTEKRLKYPGKMRKIINELEQLEKIYNHLSDRDLEGRISIILSDIDKLRNRIPARDASNIFDNIIFESLPKLRGLPIRRREHENKKIHALKPEQQEMQFDTLELIDSSKEDKIHPKKRFFYRKIVID